MGSAIYPPTFKGGQPGLVGRGDASGKLYRDDGTWVTGLGNYSGELAGGSVPATSTSAGDWYVINTAGTSQSITWAVGDIAIYEGTSGNWSQVAGTGWGVPQATQTNMDDGDADVYADPEVIHGYVNPQFAARAPRQGVLSDGTSALAITQDNTSLAFGTGNLTIGLWVRLPDWTTGVTRNLFWKYSSSLGLTAYINTSDGMGISIGHGAGATAYSSTEVTGLPDNEMAFLTFVIDRSANFTPYANGQQLGSPVDISAQSAQSITSGDALAWFTNTGVVHTEGTKGESFIVNRVLTAAEVALIAKNGTAVGIIDEADMYQHLIPGSSASVLEDVSGNNNHARLGTAGITHTPRSPLQSIVPGRPMTTDGFILADAVITPSGYELVSAYALQTGTATSTITVKETSSGGTTVATGALSASVTRVALTVSNGLLAGGKKLHLANSSWAGNTVTPFFVFRRAG